MRLIGLTGSIGMGKSATADMFRAYGVPVFDADRAVHEIYARPPGVDFSAAFPEAIAEGRIDRSKLAELLVTEPQRLAGLERIVHPLVGKERQDFLASCTKAGAKNVILDIPLLFETHATASVDLVVVVSAPADVQRARVLARPGMTPERFAFIQSKQISDVEKRRGAHFLIDTARGFDYARRQVAAVLAAIDTA